MPELPAYALIWKKRSYGGHTRGEMVIRIGTRVPISVPIFASRTDLRRTTLPVRTNGKPALWRHYFYF